jgi:large subunit ribosomal protein L7/L12
MCKIDLMNLINQLSIFELNTLINELQSKIKFNIDFDEHPSQSNENILEVSSKPKFKVTLSSVKSDKKISVLKTIKVLLNLGLKESKDLIEQVPSTIKQDIFLEEANEIKIQLENAGGLVIVEKIG